MTDERSLNHSVWECKYHIVWIPKCRRKRLYGQIARHLGEIFHELARHRESRIVEGALVPRPRAHADSDTPKPRRTEEELYRGKFLGKGLLCINTRSRRGGNQAIRKGAEDNQLERREMFSDCTSIEIT